jgi:CRISPR/Cas system CSM-associated protein Csm2 small subunit
MDHEYKKIREQKYKVESKDKLSKVLKKKIQTTMIGALSTIEENLAFLWEQDDPKFSKEDMKNLYNKIRSEILDKGNNQARNIDAELSHYDVEFLKYSVKIPFVQQPKN